MRLDSNQHSEPHHSPGSLRQRSPLTPPTSWGFDRVKPSDNPSKNTLWMSGLIWLCGFLDFSIYQVTLNIQMDQVIKKYPFDGKLARDTLSGLFFTLGMVYVNYNYLRFTGSDRAYRELDSSEKKR